MLYFHQNRRIAFHEHLTHTQLEIQEETFQFISREIHDNIGLSLTLAKLYLNTLEINSVQNPKIIYETVELITQALNDLSDISKSLNSEAIRSEGFLCALQLKLDKIKKTQRFEIDFKITGNPIFLDSQSELIIYRIIQEALNNIIKHSKATEIAIWLNYNDKELTAEIRDNGIGINWEQLEKTKSTTMSAGLANMRKRAKMINGSCEIRSNNNGTTITLTIPLQTNEKSITY